MTVLGPATETTRMDMPIMPVRTRTKMSPKIDHTNDDEISIIQANKDGALT